MKTTFWWEASYGHRIFKGKGRFMGITAFGLTTDKPSLWWCYETRKWVTHLQGGGESTYAPCNSFKAFERHLKKHLIELQGYDIVLVSRYIGHNIIARVWE
jgi:hypothetical protein